MVIHGFNKRESIGKELIKEGFYLSFGSALLQNVNLQEFFKQMQPDQFFLETDAAIVSTKEIYEKAAELRKISIVDLIDQIEVNLNKIGIPV